MLALPAQFYWLAGVHTLYILIFHALVNFMPHLIYVDYGRSELQAGVHRRTTVCCGEASHQYATYEGPNLPVSILFQTIVIAPPIGIMADRLGKRVLFCAIAAVRVHFP